MNVAIAGETTMALKQNSSVVRNHTSTAVDRGKLLIAAILLLAVISTLGLRAIVSLDALAPAVATLFFGLAAVAASLGLLLRRYAPQAALVDVAGALTFVGVIVSIAIEPDQMVRLLMPSEQTD